MRPVSEEAFYIHLNIYLDCMSEFIHNRCSGATWSAIALIQADVDYDSFEEENLEDDENFIDDYLVSMYQWVSNKNGLIEYLNEQYEYWEESDPEEIGSFWIGTTEKCHYKNYEEFKNDLDLDMVLKILQNAWEASSRSETEFLEKQFINDFPFPKGTEYFCPYENMDVVSEG